MDGRIDVVRCSDRSFINPDEFKAAVGGNEFYSILARGTFRAEFASVNFGGLAIRRGRENLPRLASSSLPADRIGILTWLGAGPFPTVRGREMRRGDILCRAPDAQSYHRTAGPNEFVSVTTDVAEMTRVALEITGVELTLPPGLIVRPPEQLRAWLFSVIETTLHMNRTAPVVLASPNATAALKYSLLHALVICLSHGRKVCEGLPRSRRVKLAQRFQETVEANQEGGLSLPDICRDLDVPGRSLRFICREQLGVSPHRLLAVHRLNLARRALLRAEPDSTSVTRTVTDLGVWELGRFAVAYKSLFGESPSATLRRPADGFSPGR